MLAIECNRSVCGINNYDIETYSFACFVVINLAYLT